MTYKERKAQRLQAKIEAAREYIESKSPDFSWAGEYGDPGYTQPERGVLLADWNPFPRGFIDWLESLGFALEWYDEWTVCGNNKAWRTSPDSYFWEPNVHYVDGDIITRDDGASVWIEEISTDRASYGYGCLPSWITEEDLKGEDYELYEGDKESGWFPGQTDDPSEVAKRAIADATVDRVVFRKTEQSQFYSKWECWVRKFEKENEDGTV